MDLHGKIQKAQVEALWPPVTKHFTGTVVQVTPGCKCNSLSQPRLSRLLSRETVDAPYLQTFKDRLDGALSNLVWREVSLSMAGGDP